MRAPRRRAGLWTLTTLDNGIVSEEHWTTVDAADDLSWAVFPLFSGAARKAGQSYQGALLCSEDGLWPAGDADRIEAALGACGLRALGNVRPRARRDADASGQAGGRTTTRRRSSAPSGT